MSGDRAIFLDRDGVLNRIVERDGKAASPRSVDELVLDPEAPTALAALKDAGFRLFVVTNQPDVARGLMSAEALDGIHAAVAAALPVEEIACCRHDNADNCECRKPKPGLLTDLAQRHGLDLERSWMVGDQDRDIACGTAAGCHTMLLARPYNSQGGATRVAVSLSQAVEAILAAE